MTIPVSVTAPQFSRGWHELAAAARRVETLGFDGMFLFDHLVPIGDPFRPVFEMTTAIGAAAAATRTLRLGTLVLRAPLRGPGISMQVAVTAAMLAPGRFVLGVGAGDRLSLDEARRFGMAAGTLDERIVAVDELVGSLTRFRPELPIWIGGLHPKLLAVIKKHSVGWNAWGIPVERFAEIAAELPGVVSWGGPVVLGSNSKEAVSLGGDRPGIVGDPLAVADMLGSYIAAGADELVLSVLPNRPERWELFADEVLPRLKDQIPQPRRRFLSGSPT